MRLLQLKLEKGYALSLEMIFSLLFGNCTYGWSYDKYITQDEVKAKRRKHEEKDDETKDDGGTNAMLDRPNIASCACGKPAGVACRVVGCVCQRAPPNHCVFCLGLGEPKVDDQLDTFDWRSVVSNGASCSAALRVDTDEMTRPLNHYFCDSKKTVLLGMRPIEGCELPQSRL